MLAFSLEHAATTWWPRFYTGFVAYRLPCALVLLLAEPAAQRVGQRAPAGVAAAAVPSLFCWSFFMR